MKTSVLISAILTCVVLFCSCSNGNEKARLNLSKADQEHIEKIKEIFNTYGFKVDSTKTEEELAEIWLNVTPDSVEKILKDLANIEAIPGDECPDSVYAILKPYIDTAFD